MNELKDVYNKLIVGFTNVVELEKLGFAIVNNKFNLLNTMNIIVHQNNNVINELSIKQKENILDVYNTINLDNIFK